MAYAKKSSEGMTKYEVFQQTCRDFGTFLYDKEKGEVMGRNASSWGKITLFFVVFYLCLAGFFAAMLTAFLATLPERSEGPKLTQYLAGKPVMLTFPSHKIDGYNPNSAGSYEGFVDKINGLLSPYEKQVGVDKDKYDASFCNSSVAEGRPKSQKKQCLFDLSSLGPCYQNKTDFSYGYASGTPCFFLRMNRVFNFVPEPNSGLSYVEVSCVSDDTSMNKHITVYPSGWPVSFFPYRMEENWLSPIVGVHVNTTAKITIKCSANAKNIIKSESYLIERGATGRVRVTIGSR